VGLAAGSLIGVLIARFKVLPHRHAGFMNIIRGVTYLVSKGLGQRLPDVGGVQADRNRHFLGVNNLIVIAVGIFCLLLLHQPRSTGARSTRSAPTRAADISGFPRRRIIWLVYAAMGTLSGWRRALVAKSLGSGDTAVLRAERHRRGSARGVSVSGGSGKVRDSSWERFSSGFSTTPFRYQVSPSGSRRSRAS